MTTPSPTRILVVGHDGSAAAEPVVAWAGSVAAARGKVRVDLVHAVTLPPIPQHGGELSADELLARHEAEARSVLEADRRALAGRGVVSEVFVRRWLPAETLIEHAEEVAAGLIVVGQHSSRASRLLLGSTSSEVARDAEAPVVVVRGDVAVSPPRRVLLAADGSPACSRTAECVAAWFPAAEVLAVHLRDHGPAIELGEIAGRLAAAGLAADRLELRVAEGSPAESLLAIAESEPIDLVAAGRRGHAGWRERVLGGSAEKLLQLAPCPVLVAH